MPLVPIRLVACRPKPYSEHPQTLAEHVKSRSLELGLTQKQAAERLAINPATVLNWETGRHEPRIQSIPAILGFLGYDPFPPPTTLAERLVQARRKHGWLIREAAQVLGVDPGTWRDWERGELILFRKHRAKVAELLGLERQELSDEMQLAGTESTKVGMPRIVAKTIRVDRHPTWMGLFAQPGKGEFPDPT